MATREQVLAVMRSKMRVQHLSLRTEDAYLHWVGRYYDFAAKLPREWRPEKKAEAFLGWLAEVQRVAARTQNQAFSALLYLYKHVLGKPLKEVDALRAKRPEQIREAPTRDEVRALFAALRDTPQCPAALLARLLYGCGLRVQEPLELRIKDVRLSESLLFVRGGKGGKDRAVGIPCSLIEPLRVQIERARNVWKWDREHAPTVGVSLPHRLAAKYPRAPFDWGWFWVFPAPGHCEHPREPGLIVRWRLHEASLQRSIAEARRRAGIACRLTPHVLRHGYATHSEEDPRTIQRVMGHAQLETTMGYIHRDVERARSPLESLEVRA